MAKKVCSLSKIKKKKKKIYLIKCADRSIDLISVVNLWCANYLKRTREIIVDSLIILSSNLAHEGVEIHIFTSFLVDTRTIYIGYIYIYI